jgi:hypothetical protein
MFPFTQIVQGKKKTLLRWCILSLIFLSSLAFGYFASKSVRNLSHIAIRNPPAFIGALSDFEYVGNGIYDPQSLSDSSSVPPHTLERKPLPVRFEAGHQYIFHHRAGSDSDNFFTVLQARLRSSGATILDNHDAKVYRFNGGLAFHISFKYGNYKGFIFNTFCEQILSNEALRKQWAYDDYIVVLEEMGNND